MSESNKRNLEPYNIEQNTWEGETGERALERRAATIRNLRRSNIDDRVIKKVIERNLGTLECYDEKTGEDKGFPSIKTGDEEKKK